LRPTELIFLADSLINVGKPREAVAVLEKTAKIKALPVRGTLLLGHGYMQLQENQKAKEHFEVALAVDPNLASAHYGMATVLARLGDSQQALKHRQLYAKLKTQDLAEVDRRHGVERDTDMGDLRPVVAEIYVNAGKVFASHGKPAQAQAHWRKAAAMDPQNPDPRKLLEMSTTK
jgi:Tfp pilus assembly protein PilF